MIRTLLKLGLLAVVCIVIYNYFFGTSIEKEQSKRIFKGVGSIFTEVRSLVGTEREKFDEGKYDTALGKMQEVLGKLKSHAADANDPSLERKIAQLEKRKEELQRQVDSPKDYNTGFQKAADQVKKTAEMARQMETLTNDLQSLVNSVATPSEQ